MKRISLFLCVWIISVTLSAQEDFGRMQFPRLGEVAIQDAVWSPLMDRTIEITQWDVWRKFQGARDNRNGNEHKDEDDFWSPDRQRVETDRSKEKNAWLNFELVAGGHVGDGGHVGFPWFDGLLYETISGMSDLLFCRADDQIVEELDHAAILIERAQKADPNGYLNTYTTLEENDHRWGENGGNLRWQHDVYNSGCLVEAGVHMYEATGRTRLLEVAVRLANYMYDYMLEGCRNIVPGHALPEDAMLQLYDLCLREPDLCRKLQQPLYPEHYRRLAEYWIEQRGHTEGRRPLEQYAQDAEPVFEARTIEGHAVRATLLATGVAHAALVNRDPRYIAAASRLWDNMAERRMFITGGVGAIHEDEKFGPDYYLPTDAYLETCAAIGAGLFSWRMYELTGEAKYMDVVERILFNSIPAAVGLDGKSYTYQNPLHADKMNRWPWHDCPCCPPMLLKWLGQLPRMIYAQRGRNLYVNLFVGGSTEFLSPFYGKVAIHQTVDWLTGKVSIHCDVQKHKKDLCLHIRVPGWMRGEESPGRLYRVSSENENVCKNEDGYRVFHEADVEFCLDVSPRMVCADERVELLRGKASLASGPFVYCVEKIDNEASWNILSYAGRTFELDTTHTVVPGVPDILSTDSISGQIRAIPYYMIADRCPSTSYRVWVSAEVNCLVVNPEDVQAHITPYLYGAGMEDVNHEVYGGFYDQMLFGESFEEGPRAQGIRDMQAYDHPWNVQGEEVYIAGCQTAKLVYTPLVLEKGSAEVDVRYDGLPGSGNAAGLCLSVSECGDGADHFRGYEVSLHGSGRYLILGKHDQDFRSIGHYPMSYEATEWNRLRVDIDGAHLIVSLNGTRVFEWEDKEDPLPSGQVALRTYEVDASYRRFILSQGTQSISVGFTPVENEEVSGMWEGYSDDSSNAHFTLLHGREAKHGAQAQQMENRSESGIVGLSNMGLNRWGISLRKGHELTGSVWVRGKASHLYAVLTSQDGAKRYAIEELPSPGKKWKRVSFRLNPSEDDSCACFRFEMLGRGSVAFDAAELMHTSEDQYKGLPLRADIGEMFHAEGLTFLRYGGSMVNSPEYRYAHMRGERHLRPPYKGFWYRYSSNGFGIREFVDFADVEGYERSFAVNIEDDPEDCAQMIRDLRGRVRYVEIGNEEVLVAQRASEQYDHYVERFLLLSEAMRKEDPQLQFVCAAWWRPESEDVKRTFLALDGKAAFWDYHPGVDDYESARKVEGDLRLMKQRFLEWNPHTTMRCAVFEENGNSHRVRRMLCHAIVQNAVRRMGDFVLCTCPANALEPFGQNDNGWNQGQIFFTPSQAWGMPPYYGQQLASQNHEPLLVSGSLLNENPSLDITVTRSEDARTIVLHIVNTDRAAHNLALQIQGWQGVDRASMSILRGEEDERNTPEQPCRIVPHCEAIHLQPHFVRSIPWYTLLIPSSSYLVLRLDRCTSLSSPLSLQTPIPPVAELDIIHSK